MLPCCSFVVSPCSKKAFHVSDAKVKIKTEGKLAVEAHRAVRC
jgi:hypothetical protein